MKTKFEEVAHLYVGSETRVDLKSKPFGSNECEVIFQGIDFCTAIVPYYRLVAYSPNLKDCIRSESLWLDGSYFKPILRPLSDMTIEEEIEYRDVCNKAYEFAKYKVGDNVGWSDPRVSGAIESKWLLSKHFDLFGLIESGEAIDKTKL